MSWQSTYTRTGTHVRFTGNMTKKEIFEAHNEVFNHDFSSGLQYLLVDVSAVTSHDLWSDDIRQIADLDRSYAMKYTGIRFAFVIINPELFLAVRSWERYMEGTGARISVQQTVGEARDWLQSEGMAL
jgi:hypothetical protein